MKKSYVELTVVIPAYNESESLPELFERLESLAKEHKYKMQVILVDDGSTDDTTDCVDAYQPSKIVEFEYVQFRKNLGKSKALTEGVKRAKGEFIVTMDADLQDQPEEIPKLLRELDAGFDVVSGWKANRKDPLFGKKLPSAVFNWLVRRVLKTELKDINCGLKAYRREVWDEVSVYGEFHRFIPALAANRGFKISEVEVIHKERKHGFSKYGANRFFKGMLDLLTVYFLGLYRERPLHFFGLLGGGLSAIGLISAAYLSVLWLLGAPIGSRPLLMLAVLLIIVGVQFVLFGLMSQLHLALFQRLDEERPGLQASLSKTSHDVNADSEQT